MTGSKFNRSILFEALCVILVFCSIMTFPVSGQRPLPRPLKPASRLATQQQESPAVPSAQQLHNSSEEATEAGRPLSPSVEQSQDPSEEAAEEREVTERPHNTAEEVSVTRPLPPPQERREVSVSGRGRKCPHLKIKEKAILAKICDDCFKLFRIPEIFALCR
jgi:hypothetical protein